MTTSCLNIQSHCIDLVKIIWLFGIIIDSNASYYVFSD